MKVVRVRQEKFNYLGRWFSRELKLVHLEPKCKTLASSLGCLCSGEKELPLKSGSGVPWNGQLACSVLYTHFWNRKNTTLKYVMCIITGIHIGYLDILVYYVSPILSPFSSQELMDVRMTTIEK